MITIVATVLLSSAVAAGTGSSGNPDVHAGRTLLRAAAEAFSIRGAGAPAAERLTQASSSRDSLKNGAVTGAIAGGLAVAVLASLGCAVGDAVGGEESSCAGPLIVGTAVGAGIGAIIGIGVDAMFEQTPYAGAGGRRKGVRVSWRF